ncbi:MAG TPA: hypothetical protein VLJ59_05490 [Mycobacteriales bacterium]|nr:hypothetical protein [Mycobacteriales bacterium]
MPEHPGQDYGQDYGQSYGGQDYGGQDGSGDENAEVTIDYEYATEESIEVSMDELTASGYQPEPDDSSQYNA